MVINTNIAAESIASLLAASSANFAKSLQRLSSGSKITSPADDPAGLAVSMGFMAQSGQIDAASSNVANATSFTQTQDGFLQQVSTALTRMSQLCISAEDGTMTETDRTNMKAEFDQLAQYIGTVAKQSFNGVSMFTSAALGVTIDSQGTQWNMAAVDFTNGAYTGVVTGLDISSTAGAATALTAVTSAINQLGKDSANVGANLTRLQYTSNQLSVEKTNIDAANSAIADVDVAQESTTYAKLNILVQSGTAMLAQANVMPQSVLKLLG